MTERPSARPRKPRRKAPPPARAGATPPKKAPRPLLPPALFHSLLATGFAFVLALTYVLFVYPRQHGPGDGRAVELEVPGDESTDALASRLGSAGLVKSPRFFALYLRARGGVNAVRGPHFFTDDLSPEALVERLERSPRAGKVKVTFPEGFTRFDMARRLESARVCSGRAFLEASARADLLAEAHLEAESFEGYLFPATYELAPDADAADVVRRLKAEFDRRWAALEQKAASGLLDLGTSLAFGPREIVTLASLVEKEAAVDDERPIIAGVFLNRLREASFRPKLLQSDPTAAYGCLVDGPAVPSCAAFTGKVTHDLLQDAANRYNTYKHEGLPPGPIANPGIKSLSAVVNATPSRYFYFVAKGEGRHTFSETFAAHTAAVRGSTPKNPAP